MVGAGRELLSRLDGGEFNNRTWVEKAKVGCVGCDCRGLGRRQ